MIDSAVSSPARQKPSAKADAIRFFERVSDGKVAIEAPDGTIDTGSTPATIETISNNERQATREKLAGL